jgi:TRAP-type C4-dicarboxylate transport system permease small subunit
MSENMKTENTNEDLLFRNHFLQHGQSINKLHTLLSSNFLTGKLKRTASIMLEIILFSMFLIFLFFAIYLSTSPIKITQKLDENTTITSVLHNDEVTLLMIAIKVIVFIASLMPLLVMLLLRRNRKKGVLIYESYTEVKLMKRRFEDYSENLPS